MTAVCGQIKQGGPNYRYDGNGAPKTAFQMDEYILKGQGEEVYTPRFTFHGFRYVEVTGVPRASPRSSLAAKGCGSTPTSRPPARSPARTSGSTGSSRWCSGPS